VLESWLADDQIQRVLQLNQFEGAWWFHKESWEALLGWLATAAEIESAADASLTSEARAQRVRACRNLAAKLVEAAAESGYRLDRLVARIMV
jgi:hypothetical protein